MFPNYNCHFTFNVQNVNVKKPLLSHCSTRVRLGSLKGGKDRSALQDVAGIAICVLARSEKHGSIFIMPSL